jgi:hypothetical protein
MFVPFRAREAAARFDRITLASFSEVSAAPAELLAKCCKETTALGA